MARAASPSWSQSLAVTFEATRPSPRALKALLEMSQMVWALVDITLVMLSLTVGGAADWEANAQDAAITATTASVPTLLRMNPFPPARRPRLTLTHRRPVYSYASA